MQDSSVWAHEMVFSAFCQALVENREIPNQHRQENSWLTIFFWSAYIHMKVDCTTQVNDCGVQSRRQSSIMPARRHLGRKPMHSCSDTKRQRILTSTQGLCGCEGKPVCLSAEDSLSRRRHCTAYPMACFSASKDIVPVIAFGIVVVDGTLLQFSLVLICEGEHNIRVRRLRQCHHRTHRE